MSCRRNGLRKQVIEEKDGPLEFRREKGKGNGCLGGGRKVGERLWHGPRRKRF